MQKTIAKDVVNARALIRRALNSEKTKNILTHLFNKWENSGRIKCQWNGGKIGLYPASTAYG
jgi:hypothetical protein